MVRDWEDNPQSLDVLIRSFNSIINFAIDTGSPASFINQKTADMLLNDPASNAKFKDVKIGMRFIDYNHKTINLLGACM